MNKEEQIIKLAEILKEETENISKTYTENTKLMCKAVENLRKVLYFLIFGNLLILIIFLTMIK